MKVKLNIFERMLWRLGCLLTDISFKLKNISFKIQESICLKYDPEGVFINPRWFSLDEHGELEIE